MRVRVYSHSRYLHYLEVLEKNLAPYLLNSLSIWEASHMGKNIAEIISDTNHTILHEITKQGTNRHALAKKAGIPQTSFDRKVDGHTDWKVPELDRVANALGLKFPEVLLGDQEPSDA